MAKFNICGHECTFAGVPYAALKAYNPTPRTHLVAWRCELAGVNILLTSMLHTMHYITAITRPPFLATEENHYYCYLIEQPSDNFLDNLRLWLRSTCGTKWLITCPYKSEKDKLEREINDCCDDIAFIMEHRKVLSNMHREYYKERKPSCEDTTP